jgi:hypothetical protein
MLKIPPVLLAKHTGNDRPTAKKYACEINIEDLSPRVDGAFPSLVVWAGNSCTSD